jgi:hypothetical protein
MIYRLSVFLVFLAVLAAFAAGFQTPAAVRSSRQSTLRMSLDKYKDELAQTARSIATPGTYTFILAIP